MEALAAVALAGNILQFVETAKKLISATGQLSNLGAKEEHVELSTLARELQGWVLRVTPQDPPQGVKLCQEESICALGVQCNQVANQLLGVLKSLKAKSDNGNFGYIESFYMALLGEWKKGEIEEPQEIRGFEKFVPKGIGGPQGPVSCFISQRLAR